MASDLFIVTKRKRQLSAHPNDGRLSRWEWTTYAAGVRRNRGVHDRDTPDFWLTAEQVEELRRDSWYGGGDLEVSPVSNGPWAYYWYPEDYPYHLYLSRRVVEISYKSKPVGPFTISVTTPDDPEAWWAWQTPRDTRPVLVYRSKIVLGVACGDLTSALEREKLGRGRVLPVKLTVEASDA